MTGTPEDRPPGWRATHDPLTPEGQIEQWGLVAHGLKHNRTGRRRAARMLGGLVAVIALGALLLLLLT